MAPATVENASPIGIANVSMNRIHLENGADISHSFQTNGTLASCSGTLCLQHADELLDIRL